METPEIMMQSGNYTTIRIPGRAFPALAIQGDSLKLLQLAVSELGAELSRGNLDEATYAMNEVRNSLEDMVAVYEEACLRAGQELPYTP
ncbi:hypothetical protein DY218_04240 [Streptomyces triticagri]|uniref:Uncharacterized protein n=2 Tax=Streptomyces triticagri TaxID=2293568 RepID=A0A372MAQ6_9ACTN|nr:hypothetical protein DY218_04240 [Streptomyces triticagri]